MAGLLFLAFLVPAAAPVPPVAPSPTPAVRRAHRTEPKEPKKRPATVELVQSPRFLRESGDAGAYSGEPISLNLENADLADVLKSFAAISGLNMVLEPGLKGRVSVNLRDVPWDQALELILRVNGLGYVLEGRVMRVGSFPRLASEGFNQPSR